MDGHLHPRIWAQVWTDDKAGFQLPEPLQRDRFH